MDFWIDFVVSIRFQTFLIKFVLFLIDFRWLNQIQIRLNPDWIESRSKLTNFASKVDLSVRPFKVEIEVFDPPAIP